MKEALRLQKENNFVILDVRPEAEFKEVTLANLVDSKLATLKSLAIVYKVTHNPATTAT